MQEPSSPSSRTIPELILTKNRLTLLLNLGSGSQRRRKIEDLLGFTDPAELKNYLLNARIWKTKISYDMNESRATPGLGNCGFIAMDRIINDMDRTIGPNILNES